MNCDLHDFLEIACTYRYEVILGLEAGIQLMGKPITTLTEKGQKEFLIFQENDDSSTEHKIPLEQLRSLKVNNDKAIFLEVDFKTGEKS